MVPGHVTEDPGGIREHGKVAASTLSEREGPEGLAKEQCQHLTYV